MGLKCLAWLTLAPWCLPSLRPFSVNASSLGVKSVSNHFCGKSMSHCGVLVVKDPLGGVPSGLPGVLGMNVIRKCYQELFGQHGAALFSQPSVTSFPGPVVQALQKWHYASATAHQDVPSRLKIRGKKACRIPGGVMKIVPCHLLSIILRVQGCQGYLQVCLHLPHWFK